MKVYFCPNCGSVIMSSIDLMKPDCEDCERPMEDVTSKS